MKARRATARPQVRDGVIGIAIVTNLPAGYLQKHEQNQRNELRNTASF